MTSSFSLGWAAPEPGLVSMETAPGPDGERPELRDVARLWRRAVRHTVRTARADEQPTFASRITDFLGDGHDVPVVSETWMPYDAVNVQAGLDAWFAEPGRQVETLGVTGFRHFSFGLADLAQAGEMMQHIRPGRAATQNLPSGPGGQTLRCHECALHLVTEPDGQRLVLLQRALDPESNMTSVQVLSVDPQRAQAGLAEVRALALRHNVFRGHVLSFSGEVFDHRQSLLTFQPRPAVARDEVVLPEQVLAQVTRQILGVARHREALRAGGQHLRRGLLLYGPPGVGKTHTIRHLIGLLPDVTVLLVSGAALPAIGQAASIARSLEPAMVVIEDVDLVAMSREMMHEAQPLLFELLNQMDGLAPEADVTFVLTTNRADLLEDALAARPGRIDQAVQLDLPDAAAREQLLRLYGRGLDWDLSEQDLRDAVERTAGTTASFTKELLRRAALVSLERDPGQERPTVTGPALREALDELLASRNRMTRRVLGAETGSRQQRQADDHDAGPGHEAEDAVGWG